MKTLKPIKWAKENDYLWQGGAARIDRYMADDNYYAMIIYGNCFTTACKTLEEAKAKCQELLQNYYDTLKKKIESIEEKVGVEDTEYIKWCKENMDKIRANWKLIDPVIGDINNEN